MVAAMTRSEIRVNGEIVLLDRSGAAFVAAYRTLVFADLHFEKGSAYARRGALIPPYDTRATMRRMEEAIARLQPASVVALGDSFHDGDAAHRLDAEERATLLRLTARHDWLWVEGNHDPKPPGWLGGRVGGEIALGALILRHLPSGARGEIAGHLHPCVTVNRRGLSVRRRCFATDGASLLMPAFGAYAGGLDIGDVAVTSLFADGFAVHALGHERVYCVSAQPARRKTSEEIHPNIRAINTVETP